MIRRLVAIMFTDIEGYSAVMQNNEKEAFSWRSKHREIFSRFTAQYHGEILQYYGDGTLSIFSSAIDAVECALAIQKAMLIAPKVPLRIGIHSGDIIYNQEEIIGDSVNIASRIEGLAQAGSILISEKIYDEISNHPDFKVKSLGSYLLKNMVRKQALYALIDKDIVIPDRSYIQKRLALTGNGEKHKAKNTLVFSMFFVIVIMIIASYYFYSNQKESPLPSELVSENISRRDRFTEERSIAVLPFRNLSNDEDQLFFAQGVAEMIRNSLSQARDLKVTSMRSVLQYQESDKTIPQIGRELNVNFILDGSILKDGDHVRMIVQLINTQTDKLLWSHTFDRQISQILSIQSEIAMEITNELQAKLSRDRNRQMHYIFSSDISVYEYFLSANHHLRKYAESHEKDFNEKAIEILFKALAKDHENPIILSRLGDAYLNRVRYGYGEQWLDSAALLSMKVSSEHPEVSQGWYLSGRVQFLKGNLKDAKIHFNKTLELMPNHSDALEQLSFILVNEEDYKTGIPMMIRSLRLDPRNYQRLESLYGNMGYFLSAAGLFDKAEALYKRQIMLYPDRFDSYVRYPKLLFLMGRYEDAREIIAKQASLARNDFSSQDLLAFNYWLLGDYEKAEKIYVELMRMIEEGFEEVSLHPNFRHRLAYIWWKNGEHQKARKLFRMHIQRLMQERQNPALFGGNEYDIAASYAVIGQHALAVEWLEKVRFNPLLRILIQYDQLFDSLRARDDFQNILNESKKISDKLREVLEDKGIQDEMQWIFQH
ncbi:MAG: hypothetical protein JJU28_09180 [Cyclobacteriaceae bacterium]|nr:hypothetical protein [Cyclobacteriaceae bacterium]